MCQERKRGECGIRNAEGGNLEVGNRNAKVGKGRRAHGRVQNSSNLKGESSMKQKSHIVG
jgi:hypothetical protein